MTCYLLDVNVLIALIDTIHVQHDVAHDWFAKQGRHHWATCPITENGVMRILGRAGYPNSPGSPAGIVPLMAALLRLPEHVFWPDDISLLDPGKFDVTRFLNHGQITDAYLLALAHSHGGKLATLDRRLSVDAVHGGSAALECIA